MCSCSLQLRLLHFAHKLYILTPSLIQKMNRMTGTPANRQGPRVARLVSKKQDNSLLNSCHILMLCLLMMFCLYCVYKIDLKKQHNDVVQVVTEITNDIRNTPLGTVYNYGFNVKNDLVEEVKYKAVNASEQIKNIGEDYGIKHKVFYAWDVLKEYAQNGWNKIKGLFFKVEDKLTPTDAQDNVSGPIVVEVTRGDQYVRKETRTVIDNGQRKEIQTVTVKNNAKMTIQTSAHSEQVVTVSEQVTQTLQKPPVVPSQVLQLQIPEILPPHHSTSINPEPIHVN